MNPGDAETAWAAGLYEGEGTCMLIQVSGGIAVMMRVVMNDRDVIERFAAIIGIGSVKPQGTMWRWQVNSAVTCAGILQAFWPWLGERRRAQAQPVLDRAAYMELHPHIRHRKLTAGQVGMLRAERSDGDSFAQLAKRYGISEGHTRRICRGKAWRMEAA